VRRGLLNYISAVLEPAYEAARVGLSDAKNNGVLGLERRGMRCQACEFRASSPPMASFPRDELDEVESPTGVLHTTALGLTLCGKDYTAWKDMTGTAGRGRLAGAP
jgi:hypothetical protein